MANDKQEFDPAQPGQDNGNIFGLPHGFEEAEVILLPVPWDVTASYKDGAAAGPDAILNASPQLDLYLPDMPHDWSRGIFMMEISEEWQKKNRQLRPRAAECIQLQEKGADLSGMEENLKLINDASIELKKWVHEQTSALLGRDKLVGVIGGEHSVALGYLQALAGKYEAFGVLQIDAHADLRNGYEGFEYSHASIMHHALQIPNVIKLVQVGVRDQSETEMKITNQMDERIEQYSGQWIHERKYEGHHWKETCNIIIDKLPELVYISFDIDGLDPKLCPNTGTPVPGGLEFEQCNYLFRRLMESGRKVIGFDLCEVAPGDNDWDGNVGARVLYNLCSIIGS